ncbi:MAG TPA: hypothetical protein VHY08_19600, partial [Bacillota bacterium]|nr:hypothetical protein [Bacillota bacterium]
MKRGNLGLIVALVFMFIISGCSGSNKKSEGSWQGGEVSLDLWGFPSVYSSYNLEIYAQKNDTLLQTYNLGKVSGRYQGKITVSSEATSLTAYLINNDKCNYFWYLPTQNNSFKSSYWIDYDYFINQGYIRYGVSEDLARNISPNFIGVADFNQAPYYLYKLTAIRDQNLSVTATSQSDERIALSLGSLVNNLEFISCFTNVSRYFPNCALNDMFVLVHPDLYTSPVKADINFTTKFSIKSIDTHIYGIAAGNSPNRVYAVGGKKRYELYYINPLIGNIERTFSLPFEPRRVIYSASDNKLYITGTYSNNILIWDIANSTYS